MLDHYLKEVSVLGAAGKMGSGISLLILQEMAFQNSSKSGKAYGSKLHLIDANEAALDGLYLYLKSQLQKFAEKNTVALRQHYQERADLIENYDIIDAFVSEALVNIRLDTNIDKAAGSNLVFEAIIEDVDIKKKVYTRLKEICSEDTFFLTNTSSIPISVLNDAVGLNNRIIGYHFYNPPAVQKLVEVITTQTTKKDLIELSYVLGKSLRKKLVPANDIAGFIGNGHFIRDGLFGIQLLRELTSEFEDHEALYLVNTITQDFMIRPMGIFQLIDYVGLDVYNLILTIMRNYLNNDELQSEWVTALLNNNIKGGQTSSGAQKDGILKYEKGRISGVYSVKKGTYIMLDEGTWVKNIHDRIGRLPETHVPWKSLLMDRGRAAKLKVYFEALFNMDTMGAELAKRYLLNSKKIAQNLVKEGIAAKAEDVNAVLENGFYHIYGPINEMF
jgi:3-hydroxyacyl-CoA dehydrogenase